MFFPVLLSKIHTKQNLPHSSWILCSRDACIGDNSRPQCQKNLKKADIYSLQFPFELACVKTSEGSFDCCTECPWVQSAQPQYFQISAAGLSLQNLSPVMTITTTIMSQLTPLNFLFQKIWINNLGYLQLDLEKKTNWANASVHRASFQVGYIFKDYVLSCWKCGHPYALHKRVTYPYQLQH